MPHHWRVPLIFDHPQEPIGGYRFSDQSGVELEAKNLRSLLDAISAFRRINGLPAGNPHAEVEADYRVRHPWLVSKVGKTDDHKEDPVARWVSTQWRNPPKERDFVESVVTQSRLETCAKCPYYASGHTYLPETSRRLMILGAGRIADYSACMVNHWSVGLAALMASPEPKAVAHGCWANPPASLSTPSTT